MADKERKIITADVLEYFKAQQDIFNAQTYVSRVIYASLPTENNYSGRMVFLSSDERMYIYTSNGWKKIPWADEIPAELFETDSSGNIVAKE